LKNSKRELLLSALLIIPTVREAAASVGIPETTAYNHLRDPVFAQEYKQRKRQAVSEASSYLQLKTEISLKTRMNNCVIPGLTRDLPASTLIRGFRVMPGMTASCIME